MKLYAIVAGYIEPPTAAEPARFTIEFDACRIVNGLAGTAWVHAMNDIEAQARFVRNYAERGHTVEWVSSLDAQWIKINGAPAPSMVEERA